jgi:hypothetical protein
MWDIFTCTAPRLFSHGKDKPRDNGDGGGEDEALEGTAPDAQRDGARCGKCRCICQLRSSTPWGFRTASVVRRSRRAVAPLLTPSRRAPSPLHPPPLSLSLSPPLSLPRTPSLYRPLALQRDKFGLLVVGYDTTRGGIVMAWEPLVVMLRKLFITLAGSLLRDPYLQIMTALLILIFSLTLQALVQPYASPLLNTLDVTSLLFLVVTQVRYVCAAPLLRMLPARATKCLAHPPSFSTYAPPTHRRHERMFYECSTQVLSIIYLYLDTLDTPLPLLNMPRDQIEIGMTVLLFIANAAVIVMLIAAWIARIVYEKVAHHSVKKREARVEAALESGDLQQSAANAQSPAEIEMVTRRSHEELLFLSRTNPLQLKKERRRSLDGAAFAARTQRNAAAARERGNEMLANAYELEGRVYDLKEQCDAINAELAEKDLTIARLQAECDTLGGGAGGGARSPGSSPAGFAESLRKVSFLLFTVTFYANLAHNLTRSP